MLDIKYKNYAKTSAFLNVGWSRMIGPKGAMATQTNHTQLAKSDSAQN